MDMTPVKPTQQTLVSIKTSVVLIYRAQPRYMVHTGINSALKNLPVRYGT